MMSQNFDPKKAEQHFEKAKNKAQLLIEDPDKAKKVLNEAINKADSAKGPLEKVWQDLQLMFGIIRDWFTGEYKEVPGGSIIAILGALIYFVSPIDLVPDFIPVVGYIDDVFVIGIVISQVRADLHKYKMWKESKIA
jgi:uncharacterized membrane protein YkvA (DUF1232 family)